MTLPQAQGQSPAPATLNLHDSQHDHITSCLDFHLHPTILSHLQNLSAQNVQPQVADIQCGPGTFLASVARSSPIPATYTGFDAHAPSPSSPASFPPPLTFHTWDILSASPPAAFHSTFDVILVRGLHPLIPLAAGRGGDNDDGGHDGWTRVLSALSTLARPGAYVQWLNFDPLTARIAATRPLAPDAAVRRALAEFTDAVRARGCGNAGRIDRELERAGFGRDADADLYPLRPRVEFTAALVREVGTVMGRYGVWEAGEVGERVAACLDEVEAAGALVWYDLWCHIGRKGE